mmetsp:Transcript_41337/g.98581  ORF Transcript_41337/g.98581 Transcript_41337/m.98581 type:complete len:305 (-) Transcript_41337:488-1402(-)
MHEAVPNVDEDCPKRQEHAQLVTSSGDHEEAKEHQERIHHQVAVIRRQVNLLDFEALLCVDHTILVQRCWRPRKACLDQLKQERWKALPHVDHLCKKHSLHVLNQRPRQAVQGVDEELARYQHQIHVVCEIALLAHGAGTGQLVQVVGPLQKLLLVSDHHGVAHQTKIEEGVAKGDHKVGQEKRHIRLVLPMEAHTVGSSFCPAIHHAVHDAHDASLQHRDHHTCLAASCKIGKCHLPIPEVEQDIQKAQEDHHLEERPPFVLHNGIVRNLEILPEHVRRLRLHHRRLYDFSSVLEDLFVGLVL